MPASPLAFYDPLEPLLTCSVLRDAEILAALPPQLKASKQVSFSYFLSFSSPSPKLEELKNPALATHTGTRTVFQRFQADLADATKRIEAANIARRAAGVLEYTHASPSACNVSIGI